MLQEFEISIVDRSGKVNLVSNFLSRIINTNESSSVDDVFLDEHLFSISTNTPWLVDVTN